MDVPQHLLEKNPSKADFLAYLAFLELSCARLATQLLQPFPTMARKQPAHLTIGSAEWLDDAVAIMVELRHKLYETQTMSDALRERMTEFLSQSRRVSRLVDELVNAVKDLGRDASELGDWVDQAMA